MTVSAMRAMAETCGGEQRASVQPQLSTDYLNRYGEALMLIEMAPMDREIVADLREWRAIGYREHFATSRLRCTDSALAAYDRLDPDRRAGFESHCEAMSALIAAATVQLTRMRDGEDGSEIAETAGTSLRELIGQATRFINANGTRDIGGAGDSGLQDEIDSLFDS